MTGRKSGCGGWEGRKRSNTHAKMNVTIRLPKLRSERSLLIVGAVLCKFAFSEGCCSPSTRLNVKTLNYYDSNLFPGPNKTNYTRREKLDFPDAAASLIKQELRRFILFKIYEQVLIEYHSPVLTSGRRLILRGQIFIVGT